MSDKCLVTSVMIARSSTTAKLDAMIKSVTRTAIVICSITLAVRSSSLAEINFTANGESENLARAISWLPADTETVTVARGPFVLATSTQGQNEERARAISDKELASHFEELPLARSLAVQKRTAD